MNKKSRNVKFQKHFRSGRITRNAFLNFLRMYRRKHCGSLTGLTKAAAKEWNSMSHREKLPYMKQAARSPYRKRKPRARRRCNCRSKKNSKEEDDDTLRRKRSYSVIRQKGNVIVRRCICRRNKMKDNSKTPGRQRDYNYALYSKRSFLDDENKSRYDSSCSEMSD